MPTEPSDLRKGAHIRVSLNGRTTGYAGRVDAILSNPKTGAIKLQHPLGLKLLPMAGDYTIVTVYADGPEEP